MEVKCIVSSCGKAASKCCGSCGFVRYCSAECQKEDWKKCHKKLECVNMTKLSSESLTEEEINAVVKKITNISDRLSANRDYERSTDLLKECIDFVRDRLSRLGSGDPHSLMRDGMRLNHLTVCRLLVDLGKVYYDMPRSSETDSHCLSYMSEARKLLVQRIDAGMNEPEIWKLLLICDLKICQLYRKSGQWEKAKHHCVESVATARQCNVPDQVDYLITVLQILSLSERNLYNLPEALAVAEESYILASKHYNPAHKTVVRAAAPLIDCLMAMKDYSMADTYCRMNYANIIDPIHAGEYDADMGFDVMHLLVQIWLKKEPDDDEIIEKALADEAIDLIRKAHAYAMKGLNMESRIDCLSTLCRALLKGNELTEETEGLLHQFVTMCIAESNLYRNYTHGSFIYLHKFYFKLYESFPIGEESILVQENIVLCHKRLLEFESCSNGSVRYIKASQEIKPYFKNNAELYI